MILSGRLGKHTDAFLVKLVVNTAGKTACRFWNTDDWGGYEQVLPLQSSEQLLFYPRSARGDCLVASHLARYGGAAAVAIGHEEF